MKKNKVQKIERKKEKGLLKVDLACGQNKQPGFIGVDFAKAPGVDIVHDLNKFPWPFKDNEVDEVFISHYIEHIPLDTPKGDGLILFMNELYRIMKPGAKCMIVGPYYTSMRCWQDPTHRRAMSEAMFLYYNADWRKANRLDHYPITADFDYGYGYVMAPDWNGKNDDMKHFGIRHYNNVVSDIQVTLTKRVLEKK